MLLRLAGTRVKFQRKPGRLPAWPLLQVLSKSMDSSLATDKVELSTITRDEASGKVQYKVYEAAELEPLLEAANKAKEEEARAAQ